MENKNNALSTVQGANTQIESANNYVHFKILCQCIFHINKLRRFPLSDEAIEDWTKTIMRLRPSLSATDLQRAIDRLLTGEVDYDPEIGIRNIFIAIDTPLGYSPKPDY